MERFREHEKEFKMKQYSKRALAADVENRGNFVQDERSDGSHSYGNSDSEDGSINSNEDFNEYGYEHKMSGDFSDTGEESLALDKEWLDAFIQEKLKKAIA